MVSASYTPIIFRKHMDLPSGDGWRCVRHRQRHLNSQAPDCLSARYIAENHGVGRWPHSIAWPKQYRPAGGELHYPLTTPTLIFSDSPPPIVNKDPRTAMSSNGSAGGLERLITLSFNQTPPSHTCSKCSQSMHPCRSRNVSPLTHLQVCIVPLFAPSPPSNY